MENLADYWIQQLELEAHPEGGFYKEVYRNPLKVAQTYGERNLATSIYFLLDGDQKSHFHQLESDELWYFHAGTSVIIHIFEQGAYHRKILGSDIHKGESLQVLLPARSIFAAEVANKQSYCLLGCMVNPGFDFKDFRLASAEELTKNFPDHRDLIHAFTLK